MKCPGCGSQVTWKGEAVQMDCPYCEASIEKPAPPASPDPIRSMLQDKNGNGIPDIFEGMGHGGAVNITTTTRVESMFIVNGVQYKSLDDMPPGIRAQYEQVTHALGSADMFELPKTVQGSRASTMPHGADAGRNPGAVTAIKTAVKVKTAVSTNALNAAGDSAREMAPLNIAIYAVLGIIALFVAAGIAVWVIAAVR